MQLYPIDYIHATCITYTMTFALSYVKYESVMLIWFLSRFIIQHTIMIELVKEQRKLVVANYLDS